LIFFSFFLNQSTDTNLNASGFQDTASLFFHLYDSLYCI
jgi:hypothetical protein